MDPSTLKLRERLERAVSVALPPGCLTCSILADAFLTHALSYYPARSDQPNSESKNLRDAVWPVQLLYDDLPAASFGPTQLKVVRQYMIEEQRLSRRVINQRVSRIRRMIKWAIGNGWIDPDRLTALKAVDGLRKGRYQVRETPPVRPVPVDLVERTLTVLSPVVGVMSKLQLLTGMRPGEVVIMRWRDIDRLPELSGGSWEYRPAHHKLEHFDIERVILLGPESQRLLMPMIDQPADQYLFSPQAAMQWHWRERAKRRRTPLSCGNRAGTNRREHPRKQPGDRYTTASYGNSIRQCCRKHGLPHWSPNQLRHTFATQIRDQFGVEVAQKLLGHQNLKTTEIYSARSDAQARQAIGLVG